MKPQTKKHYEIPENPDGIGAVQDNDRALFFGFTTRRDVFAALGYIAVPADDAQLKACADCACDLLFMKPLLNGMTLTQKELTAAVNSTGFDASPTCERDAAMVLTAIHQAVSIFASSRKKVSD